MPSPIGHALGGLIVALLLPPRRFPARSLPPESAAHPDPPPDQTRQPNPPYPTYLALAALAACAPDVDFLWGRHNRETHSVVVAAFVGLAVGLATRRPRLAVACALAWASHVLFDWLGSDDSTPLGVMALWPFTTNFYFAHAYLFAAISRRYATAGFWLHNIHAVTSELLMLLPPALALWWWRRRETRRR